MSEVFRVHENDEGDVVVPDEGVFATKGYERPDTTEYMMTAAEVSAAAANAAQNLIELSEPKPVGVAERLETVERRFGFLPRSRRELSDTYGLTGEDLIAGAATHLNDVFNRQKFKTKMEDPAETVRSMTARYADYAKNARAEAGLLGLLVEDITTENGTLNTNRLGDDWRYSDSWARSIVHALWTHDVNTFKKVGEDDDASPLDTKEEGAYSVSDKAMLSRAQTMMRRQKGVFNDAITQSLKNEQQRFAFWVEKLQEARKHTIARPIAYKALVELGVIDVASSQVQPEPSK